MGEHGVKEKGGEQPEVGQGFPEPEQRMSSHGNSKGPKHSNHREHDKMLHNAMPEGYKGKGDCEA